MSYNKKSESFNNIKRAFCDEAAGHVRYMLMSENAEKDGKHDLARLFRQLSQEELGHARIWYGEEGHNADSFLKESVSGESTEATATYPGYAAKAELEGYERLADRFLANGKAEAHHHRLLMQYMEGTKEDGGHGEKEDCVWRCTVCGYRHIGTTPPERCPLCDYNRTAYTMEI